MKTVTEHIRDHAYRAAIGRAPDLAELWATQWCDELIDKCRHAMVMGYFRYGNIHNDTGDDNIASALRRLHRYDTAPDAEKRAEDLADVINLAIVEYVQRRPPFRWSDDGPEHVKPRSCVNPHWRA